MAGTIIHLSVHEVRKTGFSRAVLSLSNSNESGLSCWRAMTHSVGVDNFTEYLRVELVETLVKKSDTGFVPFSDD